MLKFIPDHIKTKKMCKNAGEKLMFIIMHVQDGYKSQENYDKVILETGRMLKFILDC